MKNQGILSNETNASRFFRLGVVLGAVSPDQLRGGPKAVWIGAAFQVIKITGALDRAVRQGNRRQEAAGVDATLGGKVAHPKELHRNGVGAHPAGGVHAGIERQRDRQDGERE